MALMKHREGNEIKWVGVRPGHRGTQITKSIVNVTNTTTILHTVTAGKVFYLCEWRHSGYTGVGGGAGKLLVRNAGDVNQYTISRIELPVLSQHGENEGSLFFPIEIPAGYDICVEATNANTWQHAFIFGWEQ